MVTFYRCRSAGRTSGADRLHDDRHYRLGSRSARGCPLHLVGERSRSGASCGRNRARSCSYCHSRSARRTRSADHLHDDRHYRHGSRSATGARATSWANEATAGRRAAETERYRAVTATPDLREELAVQTTSTTTATTATAAAHQQAARSTSWANEAATGCRAAENERDCAVTSTAIIREELALQTAATITARIMAVIVAAVRTASSSRITAVAVTARSRSFSAARRPASASFAYEVARAACC